MRGNAAGIRVGRRAALGAVLALSILLPSAGLPAREGKPIPAPQVLSPEEYEKAAKGVKEGGEALKTFKDKWSLTETGDLLKKFEGLPGGKMAVSIGRKIIVMYRDYLDKLMKFVHDIGM